MEIVIAAIVVLAATPEAKAGVEVDSRLGAIEALAECGAARLCTRAMQSLDGVCPPLQLSANQRRSFAAF